MELKLPDFCCITGVQMGEIGLTDQMIYPRHLGGYLVFAAGGVWFSLQDLCFFPTYFVAFFIYIFG
jgi:hypothetical protein